MVAVAAPAPELAPDPVQCWASATIQPEADRVTRITAVTRPWSSRCAYHCAVTGEAVVDGSGWVTDVALVASPPPTLVSVRSGGGAAHLLAVEGNRWWVEAVYD